MSSFSNKDFVHLHIHTEFSQLDGFGNPKNYAKRAKEMGFRYLGITDHGTVDGLISFQKTCRENKIRPVLGCELYMVPSLKKYEKSRERGHLTLFVKNKIGWRNLLRLVTLSNTKGFYYKPRIDYDMLWDHREGLVISTACSGSFLHFPGGKELAIDLFEDMDGDFYFELMPHKMKSADKLFDEIKDVWDKLIWKGYSDEDVNDSILITNDCHYILSDEAESQEVLLAIQRNAKWTDKDRWRFGIEGLHLRSVKEMVAACKDFGYPDDVIEFGISNSISLAKKCSGFRIESRNISLPSPFGHEVTLDEERKKLRRLCVDGYKELFGESISANEKYFNRYKGEYDLLESKGFIRYFLMVHDLVEFCAREGILVGPGRGSVGGSLIAYLMGITKVDPIKFGLLFSRFISEERNDYPDIDLDFEDTKRDKVIAYLREKYGAENVAGVATFSRMKAKAVIKDVSRVFGVSFEEANAFTAEIEISVKGDGKDHLIEDALETDAGERFERRHPEVVKHAIRLENQIRGGSTHAAAVIVSKDSLFDGDRCAIVRRGNEHVVNWEKDDAEYMGLMKLDILGLNTLSVLNGALVLIKKGIKDETTENGFYYSEDDGGYRVGNLKRLTEDETIDLEFTRIPLNDRRVLNEFRKGHNAGVFQFNSEGMIGLCKEMEIKTFDDLVVANALYRPGTLRSGMVTEFLERRNGDHEIETAHPIISEITENTMGIIVFQEQVMFLASRLAGLSWSEADKIRKVIGKSKGKDALAAFRDSFVDGCVREKTLSKKEAAKVWKDIESFGGYGFNLSHAVEYTLIGYWCQYIKTYWPTEFLCAYLTYGANSPQKKAEIIEEVYRLGLTIRPPKVGISDPFEWTADLKTLSCPFIEVKGIGEKTAKQAAIEKEPKRTGFFKKKDKRNLENYGRLARILFDIGAFNKTEGLPKGGETYFDFTIGDDPLCGYPKLVETVGDDIFPCDIDSILSCSLTPECSGMPYVRKLRIERQDWECNDCGLRGECIKPVMPSPGLYNAAIIGEAPGRDEDEAGEGFVGRSGNLLWRIIKGFGYSRRSFHVTNVVKCYPSESRTPNDKQINTCKKYVLHELSKINCKVALVFGNTGLKFAKGIRNGITRQSGKVEWNEEMGLWTVFCVHPAYVLRDRDQEGRFEDGIRIFIDTLEKLKGES
jgi:DNA polymerase-3 subunit alpha